MAYLVLIPQQTIIGSQDVMLDNYEVLSDMLTAKDFDVTNDFLLNEFEETHFAQVIISHSLSHNQCLWILSQIKKFNVPKILYSYYHNKTEKTMEIYFPSKFLDEIKISLNHINFSITYTRLIEKIVDEKNKSIDFIYSN